MTPLGYLRKVEHFMVFLRDTDLHNEDHTQELDNHCAQIDQAWTDLSPADQLMIYNITKHIYHNVKLAPKEPDPKIQLLN